MHKRSVEASIRYPYQNCRDCFCHVLHCLGTDVWPAYPLLLSGLISQVGNLELRSDSDLSLVPSHLLLPYQGLTQQFSHDFRLSYRRVAGRFRSLDHQFPRVETARYHLFHSFELSLPLRYRVQRGTEADPTPGNLGHTIDEKARRTICQYGTLPFIIGLEFAKQNHAALMET
jgi:hypothetical protein